ncbi:MAG: hypothetical protein IJT65_05665 [Eubacterium sp.]|nr:hypothetical protein [Eubacterium sp.]
MRMTKKALAIALSILMAISMMPFTAFAATTGVADGAALKTAIAAASDGDVIEFTADNTTYPATAGALVIPVDGKDITLDLKGHTQYFRVSGETTVSYPTDLFFLKNGATLTVKDTVGGGAIYATYGGNSAAYMFNVTDSSELVINGGKFVMDAANYGGVIVYQNDATATTTINDGEFTANTGAKARRDYLINNTRGEVEINGGEFTTARTFDYVISEGNTTDTKLTINNGEFNGTMSLDVSKADTELNGGTYLDNAGDANTAVSAYLPADKIIDNTTGEIKNVAQSTVARTNSAEFTSLKDALDSVAAGATATITLLDDCTLPATYEITDNQKITIDLNGNDITTTARAFNIRHGQLTLKGTGNLNANFTGANAAVAVYGAATDSGSNYSTFTQNSTVTINAPNGYGAMIGATSGAAYGAKLQLNGTINSKYGIYINGNVAEPATKTNAAAINITGTVTASNENAVVYAAGYAKWNIYSNANLTGGSGVYIKSGTMNIYGNAVINAIGAKTDYAFNGNGADATGDAVIIDSCGYPGNIPTVTIKAGTITSANGEAVASYAKQDDPLYPNAEFPRVTGVIPANSTAVFSSDVSDLAVEGYMTVYNETAGGYVIAEKPVANDYATITLDGDIKFNFHIDVDTNNATKVVVKAVDSTKEDHTLVSKEYDVTGVTGEFTATVSVAPAQLKEAAEVEVYSGETKVAEYEMSAYDYAKTLADSNDASATVAKALINYAAAAQQAVEWNNSGDYVISQTYNLDNAVPESKAAFAAIDGVTLTSATVICRNETAVRFYYTGNVESAAISGIPGAKCTVYDNAIDVTGIPAQYIDDAFTLTINGTDIQYSVDSYNATALTYYSGNAIQTGLAQALANYGAAADAYFG